MASIRKSFSLPLKDKISDSLGFVSQTWFWFFKTVEEIARAMGQEQAFTLANGQSTAADITNLKFNKSSITMAVVEYLVQRITTSTGAQELTEAGIFICVYNPTSESWSLFSVSEHNPDDAGITFSITSTGQVKYTTTSITGTASISTLWYRARTLQGKNSLYSGVS